MDRQVVHQVNVGPKRGQEPGIPLRVHAHLGQAVIFEADGDELGRGIDVAGHSRVSPVLVGVRHRVEPPAAVPALVADAPQPNVPRVGSPIHGAFQSQLCLDRAVDVLDPVAQLLDGACANISG